MSGPRGFDQRRHDVLERLRKERDVWVATQGPAGPWLVPLSFVWDGDLVHLASGSATPTIANLRDNPACNLALGDTRDVVILRGTASVLDIATLPDRVRVHYAEKLDSDPTTWADARVEFRPERILAWHEEHELPGRRLMDDGKWADEVDGVDGVGSGR